MILYAQAGHEVEAVISGISSKDIQRSGSSSISARVSNNTLVITGSPSGITAVKIKNAVIYVVDKHTALSFWNVHLPTRGFTLYDRAPDVPSVFVFGPYLVRNATLSNSGKTLALRGDLNATTAIDIVAPPSVKSVTWNGATVHVQKTDIGTLRGTLKFSVKAPKLPNLKSVSWACTDALPEISPGFDDSKWVTADKTSTPRPLQPLGGKVGIYSTSNLAYPC